MIVISQYVSNLLNAGPKAKIDVEKILKEKYDSNIYTLKLTGKEDKNIINKFIYRLRKALFSFKYLQSDDITVIQVPFINDIRFTKKIKHKVAFIHDIEGIRKNNDKIATREINFLATCEFIIVHNNRMKEYLIEKGIDEKKIYILELFDYLCINNKKHHKIFDEKQIEVVYTGNLDKAPFLQEIEANKMNFVMNVYGVKNNEKIENDKIKYMGKYLPDELPQEINGDFGLVWDGNYDESDENKGFKNYTKYNNPHKLSCYIAAGLPVIVWKKAAVAEFVNKYNIGYTISNIYDINKINFKDYMIKKENAEKLSIKVKSGYFTQKVMNEILESLIKK